MIILLSFKSMMKLVLISSPGFARNTMYDASSKQAAMKICQI